MKLPKLHLRDLFWLVTVVAMATGWWLERTAQQKLIARLEADMERMVDRRLNLIESLQILERWGTEERPKFSSEETKRRIKVILDARDPIPQDTPAP